ncbi:MAG: PASTA domain-containing protein, partial [Gorillibacterium sp.]|nr:PASTA domain-containing protein [Gorillibacterium sp.]
MEKQFKVRSLLIGIFFFLLFFVVVGRIYWLQVVQASGLREMAQELWKEEEILNPVRGTIMDRNGRPLAEETAAYTVVVSPRDIHARGIEREVAHELTSVLKLKDDPAYLIDLEDRLYKLVTKKKPESDELRTWVEIGNEGWKIDGEKKRIIDELVKRFQDQLKQKNIAKYKVVGIYTTTTEKRSYPNGRLASQLLGYLNKDGEAIMGLEKQLNQQLTGTVGELIQETDLKGVEIPGSKMTLTPAIDGLDVRLTIDQNIQYYIEKTLRKYTAEWKPKSMTAIAVNPKTMEILGMASTPDFDPNTFWEFEDQRAFRNRAISDQFEPGSTFKIVTLAGAIEQNLWKPEAIYESGSVKFTGMSTIRDHNWIGWGPISFMEGLVRSSNVLFAKLGYEGLGKEKFKGYVNKFGFGEKTGIDLVGEGAGSAPFRWESDYARSTFGQSISVTAIQEVAAFAAIANGGKLMKPYVIKEIIEPQTGKVIQSKKPELVRQVVSPEVARQTTLALEHVMIDEHGTGLGAAISGYRIAGKTGTANIVPEGANTYSEDTWLISFIGYAPVEDPQVLIAIIADQPELSGDFHTGSSVTLPAFKEIMGETLAYMGIPTSDSKARITKAQATASVPDLLGLTTTAANAKLNAIGLTAQVLGEGAKVTRQLPAPGTDLLLGRGVVVVTGSVIKATVPDLTGMSLRDAVEIAT